MTEETSSVRPVQQVLSDVMSVVGPVGKDSENREQHFKFRGIDAILNAVSPHLATHGVIAVPRIVGRPEYEMQTTAKGKPMTSCRLVVEYRFYGPAGDYIPAVVPGEASDLSDKATSKAMSVAYRNALIQVLAIPTGDPDSDEETNERGFPATNGGSRQAQQAPPQRTAGANAVAEVAQKLGLQPQQVHAWFKKKYGFPYQQAQDSDLFEFASFMEDNPPGSEEPNPEWSSNQAADQPPF